MHHKTQSPSNINKTSIQKETTEKNMRQHKDPIQFNWARLFKILNKVIHWTTP